MKFYKSCLFAGALICAFILAVTAAQSFALSWTQSYGVGSYDTYGAPATDPFYATGYDTPLGIAKMPDGGFVVAGYLAMPKVWLHAGSRGNLGALVRYSPDGTILWQTLLRQDNDLYSNGQTYHALNNLGQIATDAQGNIFVCGSKHGNGLTTNFNRGFVAKFSPDGALLWENGFNGGTATIGDPQQVVPIGSDAINYLGLTSDGGVLVTLAQSRPNQAYTIPVLAKFNANGTLAFQRAFDNSIQYLGSTPVCESKDGSRYVMAFEYDTDGSTPGMRYGLLLLITDTAGNLVAQRAYNHADYSGEHPLSIIATNDGGFATLSKLTDDGGFLVRKLNADLSAEVFEKRITRAGGGFLPGNSLVETSDGGFLIGSATSNPSGTNGTDVLLFKVSSAGDLVFASILGGPLYEGYGSISYGTSIATELTGGGYGFAATSQSYHTGGPVSVYYHLPDWWMAKTDANRKVRNFHDAMEDLSPSLFNLTGSPQVAETFSPFSSPSYPYSLTTTPQPSFILENLALETSPDLPTLTIQAAGPRILSDRTAEAIVEQHFSYQIVSAFFPNPTLVTYSATGLPQNFAINAQTGVISGIAHVGSETVENSLPPIPIVLHATDGTDIADMTLDLAISDGAPVFTVNGSSLPVYSDPPAAPVTDQVDQVLSFATFHPGTQAGRIMNVEATTTPTNAASWQWLQNGSNGYMTYDKSSEHYVLNSKSYPQQDGVYFRSRLIVHGRSDSISNVVGPFNLTSGATRAGRPVFSMVRNGLRADFDFRGVVLSAPPGVAVRVQSTTTPSAEGTWVDLQDTGTGHMTQEGQSNVFSHTSNNVPLANNIYFRAVASVSGSVDSLSNIIGPYNLISDTPPNVMLDHPAGSSGGSGQPNDPLIFVADPSGAVNLHITGSAHVAPGSSRSVKHLSILVDGSRIETRDGVETIAIDYTTTRIGLRELDLLATDDLGAVARAGTGTLWIRIDPPNAGARVARDKNKLSRNAPEVSTPGDVFILVTDGGNWANANSWIDSHGNHGVPGINDLVVISGYTVVSLIDVQVAGLILNFGHIKGTILTIGQSLTILGGDFGPATPGNYFYLTINSSASCVMANFTLVPIDGVVENHGTWRMLGFGGLSVQNFHNTGISDFQMPLLQPAVVSAGLPLLPRLIVTNNFLNEGQVHSLITNDGGSLITNDGGSIVASGAGNMVNSAGGTIVATGGGNIIGNDGASIVAQGAGNLAAPDPKNNPLKQGSCLIGNDGASLITNDGGSLITNDGGSLQQIGAAIVAQGGGNIVATGGGNRQSSIQTSVHGEAPAGAVPNDLFVQNDGATDLNYITITGAVNVQGGTLSGSGMIDGSLLMNSGYIAPGHSSGQIAVTGDYVQSSSSTMILEAGGGEPGQFDQMQVGGHATLAGALQFHTLNGYVPLPEDPFNPLGYNSFSGSFDYASSNGQITVNPNGILLELAPTATNPLSLTSAVSRKVHGAAGPFDILLPLTGHPGVECRSSNGQHKLIFFFSNNITAAGASLNSDTGNANGAPIISANTVTVNLSGIGNGKQISVTLNGVMDEFGQFLPDVTVPMGTLIGDTSGNGTVNGTDVSQTKLQSGALVTNSNFREDVTVSGGINGTDVSLVKARSGTGISVPLPENSVSQRAGK